MEAVDRLLDHLRSRGATWEGCAVEGSHAGQCRVVSTRALTKKGQVIVRVPKEACLSALTASESTRTLLVELMQRTASTSTRYDSSGPEAGGEDDNNDSGPNWCLPLAFVLLCERALAEHSAHAAYLAVLPDHAPVPMLWSTEQRRLLDGTELQEVLQDEWEMVHREWSNHVAPMVAAHPVDCPFTVEKYLAARSVITSRAFWMDHRHKEGLVPLCDLFNHSTGGEHVHFVEGDASAPSEGGAGSLDGWMELNVYQQAAAGQELFNSYGPLANCQLLSYYGFTQPDNPEDYVQLSGAVIRAACAVNGVAGSEIKERSAWCVEMGLVPSTDKTFRFKMDGVPPEELLLLLGVIHCPKGTLAEVMGEMALLKQGQQCEEVYGSYVVDKRTAITMRCIERVYRHASQLMQAACPQTRPATAKANADTVEGLGAGMDDEKTLLTPDVCRTLLTALDRRQGMHPAGGGDEVAASTADRRRAQDAEVVIAGERRVLQAARAYVQAGWGWQVEHAVTAKREEDRDSAWDLFE